MNEKKLGNVAQIRLAQDVTIQNKSCILVKNGELELLFNKTNALDIVWAKYKGVNLSFLSKNGLNDGRGDFASNFEGGFLYTCGMDNISSCVEGKPIHGSLHYSPAQNVSVCETDGAVCVSGEVKETALFGKNLVLVRKYTVTENSLDICDTVENRDFKDTEFVLLYHVNYGYPFLDECLRLDIPASKSEPLTEIARARQADMLRITDPVDGGDEDVYYHTMNTGKVTLENPDKNITVKMLYSTESFPVTLEWKSMISGDYALGIEPSLSRFDDFKMTCLKAKEQKSYQIKICFN